MTSLAFILGVVPLILAGGAGAEMRRTLGVAVFSGMLGVTLFGVFLTPVFFFTIDWLGGTRLFTAPVMRRISAWALPLMTLGVPQAVALLRQRPWHFRRAAAPVGRNGHPAPLPVTPVKVADHADKGGHMKLPADVGPDGNGEPLKLLTPPGTPGNGEQVNRPAETGNGNNSAAPAGEAACAAPPPPASVVVPETRVPESAESQTDK
jgi:hypothetical protein